MRLNQKTGPTGRLAPLLASRRARSELGPLTVVGELKLKLKLKRAAGVLNILRPIRSGRLIDCACQEARRKRASSNRVWPV